MCRDRGELVIEAVVRHHLGKTRGAATPSAK
jgi:hypothetical protein